SYQQGIIKKVKQEKPDLIFITGDIIDHRRYDEIPSLALARQLVKLAPVYFITGNHEARADQLENLFSSLQNMGVHILRDEVVEIKIKEHSIQLTGLDDPAFILDHLDLDRTLFMTDKLQGLNKPITQANQLKILLSHRPEHLSLYAAYGYDLIFSGHAHGGQIRLPFIGGLFSPNQGFLPRLTAGRHTDKQSTMFISRGLGNSVFPFRIFNRPEII